MECGRLPYLEIAEDDKEVRYLGYALPLTVGEYEVLKAVFYSDGYIDKSRIRDFVPQDLKMSQASIPVHITAINKKSVKMGGKKLIGFKKNCGYFIESNI